MKNPYLNKPNFKNLGIVTGEAVNLSPEELIKTEYLQQGKTILPVIQTTVKKINLVTWSRLNQELLETQILKYGGMLFRNFNVNSISEFENFIKVFSEELLDYIYASSPRTQVNGKIYTSTEYPAALSIPLHNEMSYSRNWPMKIWFFCLKSAEKGGETPVADSRKVWQRISPKLREQFREKKIMYVRNYDIGLDISWQKVFQTEDKKEVENYCIKEGIELEWKDDNHLRTRQICQAIATHPKTGEMVWFNQAHLFHTSSLQSPIRELLLKKFKEEELPRNAYYGDGSPIESTALDEIREAYEQESMLFTWQEGDILMLNNMLAAHGRMPFAGSRKVVVGMAEPFNNQ